MGKDAWIVVMFVTEMENRVSVAMVFYSVAKRLTNVKFVEAIILVWIVMMCPMDSC